ncbi:MAG TPA: CDP-diacylglycerol--serine O-phosphatidyltransferase, partial [Opitutaceae bacterium]|nr:CDP-diacylglycerol--serine O-phosphatidyltransferase [Opitutaceae bacterium]
FLPNLMTAGNLFCGFLAVIRCIQAYTTEKLGHTGEEVTNFYWQAVMLILVAVIFDSLDGRLARLGGRQSLFGAEFDSLADVISFGIAPALMVFFLILSPAQGYPFFQKIGWFIGFIYLLCAAVRLARFNVITNPLLRGPKSSDKDFLGLPVPAAAGTVASLVLLLLRLIEQEKALRQWALALPFLLLLIACLMVSTVRYPSFKQIDWQTKTRVRTFIFVGGVAVLLIMLQDVAFFFLFLGYIVYGLVRHWQREGRMRKLRVLRKLTVKKQSPSDQ